MNDNDLDNIERAALRSDADKALIGLYPTAHPTSRIKLYPQDILELVYAAQWQRRIVATHKTNQPTIL